jgi:hypothetical protein
MQFIFCEAGTEFLNIIDTNVGLQKLKLLIHSFIHSFMELSPSREAANCAATQELPSIL